MIIEVYQFDEDGFLINQISMREEELVDRNDFTLDRPGESLKKPLYRNGKWIEGLTEKEVLEAEINNKISELKNDCTKTIYDGFTSSISDNNGEFYQFGFNDRDQLNFNSQLNKINLWKNQLSEGKMTQEEYSNKFPILWKTINFGVVPFNEDQFLQIIDDAEKHLLTQQVKYWQLENQVKSSLKVEDVKKITW